MRAIGFAAALLLVIALGVLAATLLDSEFGAWVAFAAVLALVLWRVAAWMPWGGGDPRAWGE